MTDSILSYVVYGLAYGTAILAFSFNSVTVLRAITIVSSICYAAYYYFFPAEPMWLDIVSESLFVVVNIIMLAFLYYGNRKSALSIEEKEIYAAIFSGFTPFEFYKVMKAGLWKNLDINQKIISKGEIAESLYFIYNGEVQVDLSERVLHLSDGYFVGERSFYLDQVTNADVTTTKPSRVLVWNQDKLKELFKRNPTLCDSFEKTITTDLAKKLNL